jgi:hypothetical protein
MYFNVSCMYPDRILMCPVHIHQDTSRYIKIHQDKSRYNKIHLQIRTSLDTIEIHVSHYVFYMYPSCIPHVSSMYPRTSADTCISYVSRMYPACIPRARYMYFHVSHLYPKMYLGLVRDTCRIHADTCILLECNRAFKIHLRYIRIYKGYMYPSGYMQDTCRIHRNTSGYVSDRNPPPKRIGNPP